MFMTFWYILSDSGQYLELKVFKNLLAVKKKKKTSNDYYDYSCFWK